MNRPAISGAVHYHPGPPWPVVPGEPLGIARPIAMSRLSCMVGAAVVECRECTLALARSLAYDYEAIAALAATCYAAMPDPLPGIPQPVYAVRQASRRAAASRERDFSPVGDALRSMTPRDRGVVLADLVDMVVEKIRRTPPPPDAPMSGL
jgi:hypothetical protein